jgi:Tfp pilus assembly protein PilN
MITINLRPGQKRKRAGSPLKGVGERFRALGGKVKDPMLIAAVAAWVIAGGFLAVTWVSSTAQLSALEPKLEEARSEHQRFQTFLAQKRKQEMINDSLLAQIAVIREVDGARYVWPHVLDEIAKALPAYTWLTRLGALAPAAEAGVTAATDSTAADSAAPPPPLTFNIEGRTVDIQAYTRFLRQLEASPWVDRVTPVSAMTIVEKERPVTAFIIRAQFKLADSAYIRTVPLSESVR